MSKFKSILTNIKDMLIKKKKIAIPVALVIVLAIGSITAYAISTSNRTVETLAPVAETKETEAESESEEFTANISVELMGVTADNITLPAEVEIILDANAELLDNESKTISDASLKLYEATEIAELPEGDYTVHLLAAPVEIDGSTYKLPKTAIEFTVTEDAESLTDATDVEDEDGNVTAKKIVKDDYTIIYDGVDGDLAISIELERIDVEDMTKEQLTAVVERIQEEKPEEYADLIKELTTKAETAESNPETANDVTAESESTGQSETTPTPEKDTSSGSGSNGSGNNSSGNNNNNTNTGTDSNSNNNSSSNNNSGSTTGGGNSSSETTTPTETTHTHTWVNHTTQVAREETYIVREWDEQVQVGSTPIYETQYVCPICGHTDTRHAVASHIASAHIDYIRENGSVSPTTTQVQVGETPIYETQHKVEYGTRTVYDTVVDYQYCSGCGQKK